MALHNKIKIRGFEESAELPEDNSTPQDHIHFFNGVPRENATNNSRLAERASLQGAQSGLLHERASIEGEEEEF